MTTELKTLSRGLEILLKFDAEHMELGLSELHRMTGLPKSVISRILKTFEDHDFLKQDPMTKKYRLGIRLFELGRLVVDQMNLTKVARPVMEDIARRTEETVLLCVEDEYQQVCIESISSNKRVNLASRPGTRIPLHAGASAKLLLAFMPVERRMHYYESFGLERFTPHTITDRDELERELEVIRRKGFATTFEERDLGTAGVAAPIVDHRGQVIASLTIVGLKPRFTDSRLPELTECVVAGAQVISSELGSRQPSAQS